MNDDKNINPIKPSDKWFVDAAINISYRAGEDAESAKKWAIVATALSVISIVLRFV